MEIRFSIGQKAREQSSGGACGTRAHVHTRTHGSCPQSTAREAGAARSPAHRPPANRHPAPPVPLFALILLSKTHFSPWSIVSAFSSNKLQPVKQEKEKGRGRKSKGCYLSLMNSRKFLIKKCVTAQPVAGNGRCPRTAEKRQVTTLTPTLARQQPLTLKSPTAKAHGH